ncbi:FMN-binding negative transcriptional regulator [Roseateles sp. SL47]|uniref:FMN-binding negative transcriptional regulator n=1 Tax=Roseateles sp. SL47 TaxID=2995138 RepID=UPI00226FE09A|nr:FMN-binding negative transcriptional regulator [Roseateles sp. SL47]WAC70858.1 FMN-binding negative transcriptional regulator [Roseateles sp. SL47]
MHTPNSSELPDLSMARLLIQQHPLATLMLQDPTHGLSAVPVPMIWGAEKNKPDQWWVEGHMARSNQNTDALVSGKAGQVLVQFSGPGAYVSPRHYDVSKSVPTWNYVTVQIHGRVQIIDNPLEKDTLLKRLIATQEPAYARDWSGLPADRDGKLLGSIIGFRIPVERCVLKVKLSQNRSEGERSRILAHQRKGSYEEQVLARWMTLLAQR